MAAVLAVAAGKPPSTVVLVLAAALAGQLSVGWSNDLVDAARDRAAGRPDKPVAAGGVRPRTVGIALAAATGAVVPLSLALGWRAGVLHLLAVAAAWSYNGGLKATVLSPAAYAAAFGAMPAVATLARPDPVGPPGWTIAVGALLGVGAHFGNVLPDIEDDRRAGVLGAPQRTGRAGSAVVAALALAAAGVLLVASPRPDAVQALLGAVVVALAVLVASAARRGARTGRAFGAAMLAAAVCVAMLVRSGALGG